MPLAAWSAVESYADQPQARPSPTTAAVALFPVSLSSALRSTSPLDGAGCSIGALGRSVSVRTKGQHLDVGSTGQRIDDDRTGPADRRPDDWFALASFVRSRRGRRRVTFAACADGRRASGRRGRRDAGSCGACHLRCTCATACGPVRVRPVSSEKLKLRTYIRTYTSAAFYACFVFTYGPTADLGRRSHQFLGKETRSYGHAPSLLRENKTSPSTTCACTGY